MSDMGVLSCTFFLPLEGKRMSGVWNTPSNLSHKWENGSKILLFMIFLGRYGTTWNQSIFSLHRVLIL